MSIVTTLQLFFASFAPLFFAIDAPGILPAFLSVTGDVSLVRRRKIVLQAVITAFCVSVSFTF
ncbi:MAG: hypothetical protein KDD25_10530, partial [Bdellovibrionales bacterium]|nr:hypothetical protein [Bdellovibrionales bacterium]